MTTDKVVMKATEPPAAPERHDWAAIAKKLRSKPGVWYLAVAGCKASTIQAIRQGSITHLLASDGFEVKQANTTGVGVTPKRADLYLRYVKNEEQS